MLADGRIQWSNSINGQLFLEVCNQAIRCIAERSWKMNPRIRIKIALVALTYLAVVASQTGRKGALQPGSPSSAVTRNAVRKAGDQYRDAKYIVRGRYGGAPSYMTSALEVENEVITDVTVTPTTEENETSRSYQGTLLRPYPVRGSIDAWRIVRLGLLLVRVGCADGFNSALDMIVSGGMRSKAAAELFGT